MHFEVFLGTQLCRSAQVDGAPELSRNLRAHLENFRNILYVLHIGISVCLSWSYFIYPQILLICVLNMEGSL